MQEPDTCFSQAANNAPLVSQADFAPGRARFRNRPCRDVTRPAKVPGWLEGIWKSGHSSLHAGILRVDKIVIFVEEVIARPSRRVFSRVHTLVAKALVIGRLVFIRKVHSFLISYC